MSPALKTFLKVLLGAVSTAVAGVLVDPSNYAAFGGLAAIFAAVGAFIASKIEGLAASA